MGLNLSVALVEPEHEINAGHVARIMKNFGVNELLLVNPKFDMQKAGIFAVHGKDILEKAKMIDFDHLKKYDRLVGCTAIRSTDRSNVTRDSVNLPELTRILSDYKHDICLVLGRESTGLTNEELSKCDVIVSIDTGTDYRTLNISHALAILLYELSRNSVQKKRNLSSTHERELLIDYALKLAKATGYRRHKTSLLAMALKRFMGRNLITSKEAMLMVTLLRMALLTIGRKRKRSVLNS